jgi:hypothetical protein
MMGKMKVLKCIFAIGLSALFVGCSLEQDPLAGKSDQIRGATPTPPPDQKPDPINSGNLVIDAPDHKTFIEGTESSFEVQSRVLIPGYDQTQIAIEDMSAAPGATFDPKIGQLKWTPPIGFTAGEAIRSIKISLRAVATSSKDPSRVPISRSSSITLAVQKNPQEPTIDSVYGMNVTLRENSMQRFQVKVKDPNSAGQAGQEPTLLFLAPDSSHINLAPFITDSNGTYDSNSETWSYWMRLDIGQELTDSSSPAGFEIQAVSSFGKRSSVYRVDTKIYTKLMDPVTNLKDGQVLKPDVENHVSFVVYDPKNEGILSIENQSIPMGAILSCSTSSGQTLECDFIYTPVGTPGQTGSGRIRFDVRSRNRDSNDNQTARAQFNFSFQVEAPSAPTPIPGPTPPSTHNKGGGR